MNILDWLIPRFITEWVVLVDNGEFYEPICALGDLNYWEFSQDMRFQKWKSLNLFGQAMFPKAIGDVYQINSFYDVPELLKK